MSLELTWLKPEEVYIDGLYIMTRTDDDNHMCVIIIRGYLSDDDETKISNFDEECRFFGPIPQRVEF